MSKKIIAIFAIASGALAPVFAAPLQCISAPERTKPCPNLLYTAVDVQQRSTLICVCKSDKQPLLELISDTDNAKSRVSLRKLLSDHNITSEQLLTISQSLPN